MKTTLRPKPNYLTIIEIARMCGVPKDTVYSLIYNNRIPKDFIVKEKISGRGQKKYRYFIEKEWAREHLVPDPFTKKSRGTVTRELEVDPAV